MKRSSFFIAALLLVLGTVTSSYAGDVFISELADPNNDATLRFVEIHNAADLAQDLTGWELRKYTNASATVSQTLALTGSIPALGNFVIAAGTDVSAFETAYGMAPDMWDAGENDVAGSNGDDNLELVNASGVVVDQFGVPGEDGTGTNHEFEDGRALRLATVTAGNPVWDPAEWAIDSDQPSGLGAIDAPDGFDPYVWPSAIELELVNAYTISDTEIEVVYSGDLTAVDVADYSLAGTAGVTFTTATIDDSDASLVHLVSAATIEGDIVVDTLLDAANEGSFEMYAGIMAIGFTNTLNPGGQIEQDIPGTYFGLVTANDAYNNVWVNDGDEAYMGVLIFDYDFDGSVAVGDQVLFTATLDVYENLSELKNPMLIEIESSGNPTIPALITGSEIDSSLAAETNPAEQWEGQLVLIENATVLTSDMENYTYELTDDGGVTKFIVADNVDYHFGNITLNEGSQYSITGVVDYDDGMYRVNPRDMDDVFEIIVDHNLNLTFDEESDAANWGVFDGATGYTTVTHDATAGVDGTGAMVFGDGGYGYYIKRTVSATVGTAYMLSMDIKTVGWDTPDTYPITLAVEGLDVAENSISINSLTEFTTITLMGTVTSADGYIKLEGSNTLAANVGGTISVTVDNLVFVDDYVEPNFDLDLVFEDDTDAASWGVYDGTSGYTTVAHDATAGVDGTGALVFGDGGYGYYIKRPVTATPGTDYSLSIDIKTVGWDTPDTYPITLAVEGLDVAENSVSINSLTEFTTITLMGTATSANGYIKLEGSNTLAGSVGGTISVTIDNLMFDDDHIVEEVDIDVLVNEFDTNTSSAEYIEIYNTTDLAIDLATDAHVLVFVNGSNDLIYQATDLVGSLPANGFFVIAETGVTDIEGYTPDQNAAWGSFQNGTDGFALVKGAAASDFANDAVYSTSLAAVTGASQQDAVIYAGGDYPDTDLETEFNLPGIVILNGSSGSSARVTDGQGGADYENSDWEIAVIRTPGSTNVLPPSLISAYTISDTEIEVMYSGDLTAVDVADYSLAGTAGVTFTTATIDDTDASLVHLVSAATIEGDIVVDTLMDAGTEGSFEMYAGIMAIGYTNAMNPGGQIEEDIPGTYFGLVTANDAYNNIWVNDGDEAYMGVLVFDYDFDGLVAVGDQILFTAILDIYNNLSELKNPMLIELESSGNPTIPAMIAGADIDSSLAADTNPAEQWEGQLVTIDTATVLAFDAANYTYELTDDGGTTMFLLGDNVDYHLGNITLDVGTNYTITGVVDYTDDTYRINPRGMGDVIDLSESPAIVSVVSMNDSLINVAYSRDMSAVDVLDYAIAGTAVSFDSATIDAVDATLVHLIASAAITADGIMDTLIDAANADTVMLYAGITPISFTNALNPDGQIQLGIPASFAGLITANDAYNNAWINDATGGYNGVLLYDYDIVDAVAVGDEVVIAGELDIYNNLSELKRIDLIETISSGNPTVPTAIMSADIDSSLAADTNPAEMWEGQLVSIDTATVLSYNGSDYRYELTTDGGATTFLLGDDVDYHFGNISLNVGSTYNLVGVVSYLYGSYVFSPRSMDDVEELDVAAPEVMSVVAVNETTTQIRYSESVFPDALEMQYYLVDGVAPTNALWPAVDADMKVVILEHAALEANMPHELIVSGIQDTWGNAMAAADTIGFVYERPGTLPIDNVIFDFVDGTGNFWQPTGSGSTYGILDASTFASTDTISYTGSNSGEINVLDDPDDAGGWFVRLYDGNGGFPDRIQADSKLFFYLRAGNADMQIRLVVRDDDGYEVSDWQDVTYAEADWQVISLDLLNDQVTGWVNGNGSINAAGGDVGISGIHIKCSEDISTTLFVDMITERYNIDPVDVTFELDMGVQALMENFTPGTDFVDVAGNFNGWGENSMVLDATGADTMYTYTLTGMYPGQNLEYKFRINGSWSDETAEFPFGGPARTYVIPDTNSVVFAYYNNVEVPVGINGVEIPDVYALHNNYPNPFNPITNIKYDIPENAYVRISVYNTLGQHVIDLVNEDQSPGFYQLQWNGLSKHGTPVSSGMYIYRLTTSEFTKSAKMTYLK